MIFGKEIAKPKSSSLGEPGNHVVDVQIVLVPEILLLKRSWSSGARCGIPLEYCIRVLRSHPSSGAVRIELALPPDQISEGMDQRIRSTLNRYCEHRIAYNQRERRAVRLDGLFSLWIGLPIVILGFVLVFIKSSIVGTSGNADLVLDSGGWVLVWVGLWFPLDTLLFTPLSYGRENRVLRRLRTAEIVVEPHPMMKL